MIKIRILDAHGESVRQDEIATVYASDMDYNPYFRRIELRADGEACLTVPEGPVILHAKLTLPGYGFMWIKADNMGRGYDIDADIDFIREAAESRVYEVREYLAKKNFEPSVKCRSLLTDAETMLNLAGFKENAPELNVTALVAGMWSGELAAVEYARQKNAGVKREGFLFGAGAFNYPYDDKPGVREKFDGVFNYSTLPFYLAWLEREKDKPDYSRLDKLQDEFEKSGIVTKAHPMWWAHEIAGMPSWAHDLSWEDGSIAREIDRVIKRSVNRYKGRIHYYDAINEAHDWCNAYNLTQDKQVEMTKLCCDAIHSADPEANAVINSCFMFGENVADGRVQWGIINERNMTPYTYMQKVEELGIKYETIGIQLYLPSRDMLEIDKLYDRFSVFKKPIHLTELGVPSRYEALPAGETDGGIYCLRYMYYGLWHEMGWNERLQADWLEDFYEISYARPEVEALTWWSICDPAYIPGGGLLNKDGTPKEAYFRLKALQKRWGY